MIYAANPAAYKVSCDQNILCFHQSQTHSMFGPNNCLYLKLRISNLNQHEMTVIFVIGDIYNAHRWTYKAKWIYSHLGIRVFEVCVLSGDS